MSTSQASEQFTSLADGGTLTDTIVALEEHGFSVESVDEVSAARDAVLARIPQGASVMTNASVTLEKSGIAEVINSSGDHDSVRNRMMELDFVTQGQQMKRIAGRIHVVFIQQQIGF